MGIINRLDTFTANAIAAGEVVERPASIVKELVENALDAGSTAITVEIQNGGISMIRVTDNGCGIHSEDATVCFERHATSKIAAACDLDSIQTLGFRGEALASIAAISQVELKTRVHGTQTGYGVQISGGEVTFAGEVGCPEGTNLIVRNVFFNTPARMKFLKKPAQEAGYIGDFLAKAILSRPEVAFRLLNNGKPVFQSAGDGQLLNAIYVVYGQEVVKTMQKVDFTYDDIRVSGYVSGSSGAKANRSYQAFFINGRYVKSNLLSSAVQNGFGTRLTVGRFPVCVLHVEIDYTQVDVNIHPNKLEVRFGNEQQIYDCTSKAIEASFGVQNAVEYVAPALQPNKDIQIKSGLLGQIHTVAAQPVLQASIQPTPQPPAQPPKHPADQPINRQPAPIAVNQSRSTFSEPQKLTQPAPSLPTAQSFDFVIPSPTRMTVRESADAQTPLTFDTKKEEVQLLGQLFSTYLLVEKEDALFLIDQHAAHERMLYDELVRSSCTLSSQRLLFPYELALSPTQFAAFETHLPELQMLGYEFVVKESLLVDMVATAHILGESEAAGFFYDALDALGGFGRTTPAALKRERLMQLACKHAIRGQDVLTQSEALCLLERFEQLDEFNCPHGRPIVVRMKKREIEKLFKRVE